MAAGLAYDEKFLEHLCFLTDMFYPNRFDVIILPNDTAGSIAFRGVLDKKWLRVEPSFLRSLYGGTAYSLTMVGQVTKLPKSLAETTVSPPEPAQENSSLRDAYQNLIKHGYRVEDTFTVSQLRAEVSISPIAIYRESILPKPETQE